MFKKATIIKGLILLVVVGIIGGIGWAAQQIPKKRATKTQTEIQKESKESPETTTTTEATTTTGAVDTSNWLTYKDEKYGFEIKYPFFSRKERKEKVRDYDQKTQKWITKEISIPQITEQITESEINDNEHHVNIRLPFPEGTLLLRKELIIITKRFESGSSSECSIIRELVSDELAIPKTVYVGDIEFKREEGAEAGMGKSEKIIIYSTIRENQCISIGLSILSASAGVYYPSPPPDFDRKKEFQILEQILSTFKFTK